MEGLSEFKKGLDMNFIIISLWSSSVRRFAKPENLFLVDCRKEFLHESD